MRSLVVVLVAAGCGRIGFDTEFGPDEDGTHSGARLKMAFYDLGGGTRVPFEIRDLLRGERCSLDTYENPSTTQCLPDRMITRYTDAACSEPIGVEGSCVPAKYIESSGRMYERGEPVTATEAYADNYGTCTAATSTLPAVAVGAEIPSTHFVSLVRQDDVENDRIVRRFYESSDGFRAEALALDKVTGLPCSFGEAGCIPTGSAAFATYWADPSCTIPTGYTFSQPVPPIALLLYSECAAPRYFLVEREMALGEKNYFSGTGSCIEVGRTTTFRWWRAGPEITLQAPTKILPNESTPRIQHVMVERDGLRVRRGLYDVELGLECELGHTLDGVMRCLPTGMGDITSGFSDPGCTIPVTLGEQFEPTSCPTAVPALFQHRVSECTGYTSEVYTRGPLWPGELYTGEPGSCSLSMVGPTYTRTFYELTPVDPSTFAVATVVVP